MRFVGRLEMMLPVKFKRSDQLIQAYFFPAAADSVLASVIFPQGLPGIEGDELICFANSKDQLVQLILD